MLEKFVLFGRGLSDVYVFFEKKLIDSAFEFFRKHGFSQTKKFNADKNKYY